ncbi:PP2C family protein-serine/threonine phosphatase [Sphingopyxis sp.]|uniref:PP2C family protein-serine/threonine phosphatase n=1 Tax=Sphingopyxis sp. TaxID=1908224 RepID=UPI003D11856B
MKFFRIFGRDAPQVIDGSVTAIESVALTHVGHVRAVNEDRILNLPDSKLWAVADGMGGHQSGDVAAQIAIDALGDLASSGQILCGDDILRAIQSANMLIFDRYSEAERRSGTTIVAALLVNDRLEIFWAGDSRAYRLRGGTWQQLTCDHSVVQQMVDAGALPPSAAAHHPKSNVITRALGVDREVVIDRVAIPIVTGDIIMLCSDGVSRTLDADRVGAPPLRALAQSLIDRALMRDGSDNASLVVIQA